MTDFHKDIYIGALFVAGMIGFMSGEFVMSSVVFAFASVASNVKFNRKRVGTREPLCG
jgi:hypothetical protein